MWLEVIVQGCRWCDFSPVVVRFLEDLVLLKVRVECGFEYGKSSSERGRERDGALTRDLFIAELGGWLSCGI